MKDDRKTQEERMASAKMLAQLSEHKHRESQLAKERRKVIELRRIKSPPVRKPSMAQSILDLCCPHCGCSLKVRLEADDPSLTASDPDPVETSAIPF